MYMYCNSTSDASKMTGIEQRVVYATNKDRMVYEPIELRVTVPSTWRLIKPNSQSNKLKDIFNFSHFFHAQMC